jgi:hypothetical protein
MHAMHSPGRPGSVADRDDVAWPGRRDRWVERRARRDAAVVQQIGVENGSESLVYDRRRVTGQGKQEQGPKELARPLTLPTGHPKESSRTVEGTRGFRTAFDPLPSASILANQCWNKVNTPGPASAPIVTTTRLFMVHPAHDGSSGIRTVRPGWAMLSPVSHRRIDVESIACKNPSAGHGRQLPTVLCGDRHWLVWGCDRRCRTTVAPCANVASARASDFPPFRRQRNPRILGFHSKGLSRQRIPFQRPFQNVVARQEEKYRASI